MMGRGQLGVWSLELRVIEDEAASTAIRALEAFGCSSAWMPGRDLQPGLFDRVELLLRSTSLIQIGIGVANIWHHDPLDLGESLIRLRRSYPGRFLLGLGVGHPSRINVGDERPYHQPLKHMRDVLDALQSRVGRDLMSENVVIAALGPRMLELAGERCAGALTYLITPGHTAQARAILGKEALLIAEQPAVPIDAPDARVAAEEHVRRYLELTNYRQNLERLGVIDTSATDDDAVSAAVEAVVVIGDATAQRRRLQQHIDNGATQACMHVLGTDGTAPIEAWSDVLSQA